MKLRQFEEADKFCMIAVENCHTCFSQELRMADGTWILPRLPDDLLDETWSRWLGELMSASISVSNLIVLRKQQSQTPRILDREHTTLEKEAVEYFRCLRVSGALEYDSACVVKGSVVGGQAEARQVYRLPQFFPTQGMLRNPVTTDRLRTAAAARMMRQRMLSDENLYRRLNRGLRTLDDGFRHYRGDDRLHQFVRALEALVLPEAGKTRKQFTDRCLTFTSGSQAEKTVLIEAYDMRCDSEHMHEWDRTLVSYALGDREPVAMKRTRQMETLASDVYSHLLVTEAIHRHFATDSDIVAFWRLHERDRRQLWTKRTDLSSIH